MEASSAVFFFSVKPLLPFNLCSSSPSSSSSSSPPRHLLVVNFKPRTIKSLMFPPSSRGSLSLSPPFAVAEALEQVADTSDSPRGASHKIDKNGRFCSPRAARELALSLRLITFLMQDQPAARILELCILHLAMAEVTVIGTRHQIVINEAVDLAKRFYDGCAS
ncbi:uncharacterized protein LOC120112482 isoform X3 [Phoenix dactylifera]|uniref:Uncharacterized protein LOC120112482 isoform X3 n=1 Tax=Phoenix dactylifera TaxID=42345 RepID=A0A8B9AVT7_PHODC|nr:uncharacterized protein LOC120112482 isoform X3 [Phoenix dactylifera]